MISFELWCFFLWIQASSLDKQFFGEKIKVTNFTKKICSSPTHTLTRPSHDPETQRNNVREGRIIEQRTKVIVNDVAFLLSKVNRERIPNQSIGWTKG